MSSLNYFDIAWMSRVDGPGVRTVLFLQGCHLRCPWCHSPQSWSRERSLLFFPERCSLCGECARVCSARAHSFSEGVHRIDSGRCEACGSCAEVCPASAPGAWKESALGLSGKSDSVERIYSHLRPQLDILRDCGGLTLSGGEPLLQAAGVEELLGRCRADGISTALETSASVPRKVLEKMAGLVDCWLFGLRPLPLKHGDHSAVADPESVRKNLSFLKESAKGRILLRLPVVPGYTDSEESVEEILELMKAHGLSEIELLPHHAHAGHYYDAMQITYPAADAPLPSQEHLQRMTERFAKEGLRARVVF